MIGSYGASGKAYIQWCANMAQSLDIGVPWIMCQQDDAPQPMVNSLAKVHDFRYINLYIY